VFRSGVLIIDDDDLVAVALYGHLVRAAIDVDLATDPRRANELIRERPYALIVMDAYLTGMLRDSAAEFIRTVQRSCPDAQVILLTAYGSSYLGDGIGPTHHVKVVPKPQSVAALSALIGEFLAHGTFADSRGTS
jgi:DNA-binding NtrC family response regulator